VREYYEVVVLPDLGPVGFDADLRAMLSLGAEAKTDKLHGPFSLLKPRSLGLASAGRSSGT